VERTAEKWLHEAWHRLTPLVEGAIADVFGEDAEHYAAPRYQTAVGYWPLVRKGKQPLGYCQDPCTCHDGETYTVFISPELAGHRRRTTLTLGTLGHEMIHAWLTTEHGHNRRFQKVAHAMGYRSPYKSVALQDMTPTLLHELRRIGRALGRCPWKPLRP
jgi:hypothetical protein